MRNGASRLRWIVCACFEGVFDVAYLVEHDGELAAVEARHQVAGAGKFLQAPADVLQHAIAHLEAKRVVDVNEAVERHDQQPDLVVGRGARASGARLRAFRRVAANAPRASTRLGDR